MSTDFDWVEQHTGPHVFCLVSLCCIQMHEWQSAAEQNPLFPALLRGLDGLVPVSQCLSTGTFWSGLVTCLSLGAGEQNPCQQTNGNIAFLYLTIRVHRGGASAPLWALLLHSALPLTHSWYRRHRLLWDFRQILIEQVSIIYILIFWAGLNFCCSHGEADDWVDNLTVSLTYKRSPIGPFGAHFLQQNLILQSAFSTVNRFVPKAPRMFGCSCPTDQKIMTNRSSVCVWRSGIVTHLLRTSASQKGPVVWSKGPFLTRSCGLSLYF